MINGPHFDRKIGCPPHPRKKRCHHFAKGGIKSSEFQVKAPIPPSISEQLDVKQFSKTDKRTRKNMLVGQRKLLSHEA